MGTVSSKRGRMEVRQGEAPAPTITKMENDTDSPPDHECSPPLINWVTKDIHFVDDQGRNYLHNAFLHGADNECIITQLIRMGCDVNGDDNMGQKPIHFAAAKGHARSLSKLIAFKAEIDPEDNNGNTPFMLACQSNQTATANILLTRGARLHAENKIGRTGLHLAAQSGATECVLFLIDRKVKGNIRDRHGNSALMLACEFSNAEIVARLIKYGVKHNNANKDGQMALHLAAQTGSVECCKTLLAAHSEIDAPNKEGDTPFVCAIKSNHPRILKLLLEAGCDWMAIDGLNGTALALAILKNHNSCVKILLEAGMDPDEFGYCGLTPLMCAVHSANTTTTGMLLQYNANPNVVARNGLTALVKGIKNTCAQSEVEMLWILAMLLKAKANPNQDITLMGMFANFCPMGRQCPMTLAVATGIQPIVRMLYIAGSDICSTNCMYWEMHGILSGRHPCFNVSLGDTDRVKTFLKEITSEPRSLSALSRLAIRRRVQGVSATFVKNLLKLPIPSGLKEYLSFPELDQIIAHAKKSPRIQDPFNFPPCFSAVKAV